MTFDEFKVDFLSFLENSTVNLGRKTSKTRQAFIDQASKKFDDFISSMMIDSSCDKYKGNEEQQDNDGMSDRIMRIKPNDPRKALDIGKGVHAMTPTESMRADEQLGRTPFGNNSGE